jgi:hypothetical protein
VIGIGTWLEDGTGQQRGLTNRDLLFHCPRDRRAGQINGRAEASQAHRIPAFCGLGL